MFAGPQCVDCEPDSSGERNAGTRYFEPSSPPNFKIDHHLFSSTLIPISTSNIYIMPAKKHKFHLVREHEAEGRVAEIFEEIRETLGIPHVNVFFQAFAS